MASAQLTSIGVGIHNVLIATDFSHYSNVALTFGLQLAKGYKAQAHVVFVVPSDEFMIAGPEGYVAAREAAERDLKELKKELQRARSLVEGADYHLYLLEGSVAQSLLDFADKKQIDLIIMGTHGRSGLGKALLGSVAERVFRRSRVPVLTLGPQLNPRILGATPKKILVAADFSPASERAARYAVSLAREHRAKLTLLHVVSKKQLEALPDPARALSALQNRLAELVEPEDVAFTTRVEEGRVVPVILQTAAEMKADLLVMGVRPPIGTLERLMWPNAYEVVRESSCPVLTLRERPEY